MKCIICESDACCMVDPDHTIVLALCKECLIKRMTPGKGLFGSHSVDTDDIWDSIIMDAEASTIKPI